MDNKINFDDEEKVRRAREIADDIADARSGEKPDAFRDLEVGPLGSIRPTGLTERFSGEIRRALKLFGIKRKDRTCSREFADPFHDVVDKVYGRFDHPRAREARQFISDVQEELDQRQAALVERFKTTDPEEAMQFLEKHPQAFGVKVQEYILSTEFLNRIVEDAADDGQSCSAFMRRILNYPQFAKRLTESNLGEILKFRHSDPELVRLSIDVCSDKFTDRFQEMILRKIAKNEPDAAQALRKGSLHQLFIKRVGEDRLSPSSRKTLFERGFTDIEQSE